MAERLSDDEVARRLESTSEWSVVEGKLHREFKFRDFAEAFGFMAKVALAAEKLDHHPDWSNSWNKVVVDVTNHSAGGISDVCFELVARVDRAAGAPASDSGKG